MLAFFIHYLRHVRSFSRHETQYSYTTYRINLWNIVKSEPTKDLFSERLANVDLNVFMFAITLAIIN